MNPFATAAMAEGYAQSRPALHEPIIARIVSSLGLTSLGQIALDIGCGSGLSAIPLIARARLAIGIEPVHAMAACAKAVAPGAAFVCACGESMPFTDGIADFMTAAGSLNYAPAGEMLREALRVLAPSGILAVYDFSQGRSFADSPALDGWYREFAARYPRPLTEAIPLDAAKVKELARGFEPVGEEEFRIALPFESSAYAAYLMTETNVAAAIRRGVPTGSIRAWLESTLTGVFGGVEHTVIFPGYWVALSANESTVKYTGHQ